MFICLFVLGEVLSKIGVVLRAPDFSSCKPLLCWKSRATAWKPCFTRAPQNQTPKNNPRPKQQQSQKCSREQVHMIFCRCCLCFFRETTQEGRVHVSIPGIVPAKFWLFRWVVLGGCSFPFLPDGCTKHRHVPKGEGNWKGPLPQRQGPAEGLSQDPLPLYHSTSNYYLITVRCRNCNISNSETF